MSADSAELATADPAEERRAHLRKQTDHELAVIVADNLISLREIFETMLEGLSNVPFLKGRF